MGRRDIDIFLDIFLATFPKVTSWQLETKYPEDDDGIWFFQVGEIRYQIESSSGNFPFLVESNVNSESEFALGTEQLFSMLQLGLGLKGP